MATLIRTFSEDSLGCFFVTIDYIVVPRTALAHHSVHYVHLCTESTSLDILPTLERKRGTLT